MPDLCISHKEPVHCLSHLQPFSLISSGCVFPLGHHLQCPKHIFRRFAWQHQLREKSSDYRKTSGAHEFLNNTTNYNSVMYIFLEISLMKSTRTRNNIQFKDFDSAPLYSVERILGAVCVMVKLPYCHLLQGEWFQFLGIHIKAETR